MNVNHKEPSHGIDRISCIFSLKKILGVDEERMKNIIEKTFRLYDSYKWFKNRYLPNKERGSLPFHLKAQYSKALKSKIHKVIKLMKKMDSYLLCEANILLENPEYFFNQNENLKENLLQYENIEISQHEDLFRLDDGFMYAPKHTRNFNYVYGIMHNAVSLLYKESGDLYNNEDATREYREDFEYLKSYDPYFVFSGYEAAIHPSFEPNKYKKIT
ncbi:MAG: hypothetical protein VXZ72_01925, partial [Chlamydiota bacterium]|nr:hypothetical protein [Chlamydiota bacterium]